MFNKFLNHIYQNLDFLSESKLLIAISGGVDSVILMHLCYKLKLNFALAHCNFNLRGNESIADEDFVLKLAEELNLEVFIESFKTEAYAKQKNISIQMSARELRYNWFNDLAEHLKFDYILTAHHADDNLETFLINLSRGTGLEGLSGIPKINKKIVRPLLPFSREEIETYAKAEGLNWREDSSNNSTKYLRNKLRHEVIPKLKGINSELIQNFNTTIEHLQDSKDIIEDKIDDVSNQVIKEVNDNYISFNIAEIKKLSNQKAYLYKLLKDYGFTEWDDINSLLEAQSGKQVFSKTYRLLKDRDYLILSQLRSDTKTQILISEDEKLINTPFGVLMFDETDAISEKRAEVIFIDKEALKFPLIIRQWQEGDYFYPFGMEGKKKLSKFFKDEKLSLINKEKVWLLCSGEDIVWIINRRPDDRFKITENTRQILKVELQ